MRGRAFCDHANAATLENEAKLIPNLITDSTMETVPPPAVYEVTTIGSERYTVETYLTLQYIPPYSSLALKSAKVLLTDSAWLGSKQLVEAELDGAQRSVGLARSERRQLRALRPPKAHRALPYAAHVDSHASHAPRRHILLHIRLGQLCRRALRRRPLRRRALC